MRIRISKGEPKNRTWQLVQTAPKSLLKRYRVVKDNFVVVRKLTGTTADFIIISFHCFENWNALVCYDITDDVIFAKNV